ncbi:hypothetical protein [Alkaliphilus crotonatoxidans]
MKLSNKIRYMSTNGLLLIFEISMITISCLIVLISLVDLAFPLNEGFMTFVRRVDFAVITIFAIDLAVNLFLAQDKVKYIKSSIITIICVVPFSSFFRLAAMFRLNHVFNLLRYTAPSSGGLFSQIWIFFMKPGVARISKFFNLARSYFHKNDEPIE